MGTQKGEAFHHKSKHPARGYESYLKEYLAKEKLSKNDAFIDRRAMRKLGITNEFDTPRTRRAR